MSERVALEAEVVRRCFSRNETECSFFEYRGLQIIYRRVRRTTAFVAILFQIHCFWWCVCERDNLMLLVD